MRRAGTLLVATLCAGFLPLPGCSSADQVEPPTRVDYVKKKRRVEFDNPAGEVPKAPRKKSPRADPKG
jgi:hypothetical protein